MVFSLKQFAPFQFLKINIFLYIINEKITKSNLFIIFFGKILKMSCLCLICETSLASHLSLLSCSCLFCHDCISAWFLEALSSGNLHQIKCPNHKCHKIYSSFKFLDFFPPSQKNHLETLLLNKFLNLDEDYVICSNPQCLQICFKNKDLCLEPYRCAFCDSESHDLRSLKKVSANYFESIMNFSNAWLENASSGVYRDLFTRECPGCGISISKNGGCNHMSCRKCDSEFCWKCLGKWHYHRVFFCTMREIAKWLIISLIIILGGLKVGMHQEWDLMEVYGNFNYFAFIAMNIVVAYHNFSLFLLFYLPFLMILYSIFY